MWNSGDPYELIVLLLAAYSEERNENTGKCNVEISFFTDVRKPDKF